MSEFDGHIKVSNGSEKSFGVVFSLVFLLIALSPLIRGGGVNIWALVVSAIFLFIAYFKPRILVVPNTLWFKFGLLLGRIVAPIVIALVYIIAIVPIGLLFKMLRKDLLNCKINKGGKSYWVKRRCQPTSMKNQF